MTNVFLTVLRMSLTGSLVILAVLLVRLCLKKAPKRWSWLLWAVVLLRLLTPFGIPVSVVLPSGLPDFSQRAETVAAAAEENPLTDFSASSAAAADHGALPVPPDPDLPGTAQGTPVSPGGQDAGKTSAASSPPSEDGGKDETGRTDFRQRVWEFVPFVWLAGVMLMAGWNLAAYRLLKKRLAEAVPTGNGEVYETDRMDSAFVVGLFLPKIYLPAGLDTVEQACVIEHERAHIRRGDPWWRLLSFAALTVHWFNPLVWLAFRLSGRDMEMSCDEAVLKRTPVDIRAAYAKTLVRFASRGRSAGPVLAFGEGETGSRVKNVMKYKKPVLWVSIAAAVVLVLSVVVLAVNLTAKDTSLPFARYLINEVVFFNDDRTDEILSHMLVEIAGDGSVWVRFDNSDVDWTSSSSIEPISTEGLKEFVREQTGVKIAGITDAYRHANPESTSEWLFFSTVSGDVYFASVRTELGVMQSVSWMCSLKNEFPESTFRERISIMHPDFMARSLTKGVGREINCFRSYTEDMDSEIVCALFTAGASLNPFERDHVVYTPGVAVFQRTHRNAGMKLLGWGLAEDWTAESESWDTDMRCKSNMISFSLDDGRPLSANITLPERKISLFGRGAFEGACSVRFYEGEDPLFWSSALPHTVYTVKEMVYSVYESGEQAQAQVDSFTEGLSMLRVMFAGDGTLFTRTADGDEWQANLLLPGAGTQAWIRDGALISDCIRGIDSPEAFADMIYETTGIKVGRVIEAVVDINEPYSPNHSAYDALFTTADGKIRLATVGGRKTLERGNVMWMLELTPETVDAEETDLFFSNSLLLPVKTLLPAEEQPEVFIFEELRDREDRTILLFMAGEQVNSRIGQPDNDTPFHFGVAVFLPENNGKGLRLADCAVCPDVTVTRPFRYAGMADPAEPGTVRRDGDDFVFLTEDGQSIRAKLTLPERRKTLLGKTEYVGECSIRFPGSPEEAYEVPAFLDALPYTRYAVDEVLYFYRDLPPEQTESMSGYRFEIAGDCSLWVNDWYDTWSYTGKGTLNPIVENRSAGEWILDQTGVDIGLVKESRLFSEQTTYGVNLGWLLFSTKDSGFYAAFLFLPFGESDAPECRSLLHLRCEAEPGDRLWIDGDFAERTLQSALERDVHVPALHTVYPSGIAVVPFVAGMLWKDISGLANYDADKISCQIGAAVFELGSRSARLLKWAVCEDVSFTGWYPDREMISCEFPADNAILFTLPDKSTVRADLSLPERKSLFFGLIEQKQLVGECSIRFLPEQPAEAKQRFRAEVDAAYDAFLAEHYDQNSLVLAAYASRRLDLNGDGADELIVYRCPTNTTAYPLDIYEYDSVRGEVCAFHTSLGDIPASVHTSLGDVPASLNADPNGFYYAEIGPHDPDAPDGFYGDFFSVDGTYFLISMDGSTTWSSGSESHQRIVCHMFASVSGRLAAQTLFEAERYGGRYIDETKRHTASFDGETIPFDGFGDALLTWRHEWQFLTTTGGGAYIDVQPYIWDESEQSGWPVRKAPSSAEDGDGELWTAPGGYFSLILPAGWEDHIGIEAQEWSEEFGRLWITFYDINEREKYGDGHGDLGYLVLYRHQLERSYMVPHSEICTVTYPDGKVCDLALVLPSDVEYSPENKGHYDMWSAKLKNAAALPVFPEGCRVTVAPERAKLLLADALTKAYEKRWGTYEPLAENPQGEAGYAPDEEFLRYVIWRLRVSLGETGVWEDENYYWFPVIFPFAVDKESGAVYKVYEGWDPVTKSGYTQFTPFDPDDPAALAFAERGNTESEAQSEAVPEDGTLWTSPTGLFSLDLPEGFLDAVEVRTGEQWNGEFEDPEYWATFVLKDPGDGDGVLGSLVLFPHMLERYYATGRQEFSTLTFADGRSFEFVFVLPEDPALNNPSLYAGIYSHRLIQLRTAAATAKFADGVRVTVSPGNAAELLGTALTHAYVNIYGHEPFPLAEDPSPCPDEEYLCYAINRILTGTLGEKGSWEDENYYWYPVIFPFAVDKETGAIYKVYNGLETVFYPFDPEDPNALAFAG